MSPRFRAIFSYANVMATIAVFIALGGGAYAATQLPKNSVTSKQIKRNSIDSSKVKDASLRARDFKPNQLPAGAPGPKGDPGDIGPRGPGAVTIDGQLDVDAQTHIVYSTGGIDVQVYCDNFMGGHTTLYVQETDAATSMHGWGTFGYDSPSSVVRATKSIDGVTGKEAFGAGGGASADVDIVAQATAAGQAVKYTRFDLNVVRGSKCNYHGLITPSS